MTVFFWIIGFFVWYLIGLAVGLLCAGQYGSSLKYLSNRDIFVYLFISLFGPLLWLVAYACVCFEKRATS